MRTAVIDTGGGLRGIYGAGLFDAWLDAGIRFDLAIGVSAGGANVASFLGGQKGRNYSFYIEYSQRPQYMSVRNFLRTRNYLDLDYVYGTLSVQGGENPLNYEGIVSNPTDMIIVATHAHDATPMYFTKEDMTQDNYDILKATAAIPAVCRPYPIGDYSYFDGAISDPIPIEKAFEQGCDRAVVILTKPRDFVRQPGGADALLAKLIRKKYPQASHNLATRYDMYNRQMDVVRRYEKDGRVYIAAPKNIYGAKTLSRDTTPLKKLYEDGVHDALFVKDFLAEGEV